MSLPLLAGTGAAGIGAARRQGSEAASRRKRRRRVVLKKMAGVCILVVVDVRVWRVLEMVVWLLSVVRNGLCDCAGGFLSVVSVFECWGNWRDEKGTYILCLWSPGGDRCSHSTQVQSQAQRSPRPNGGFYVGLDGYLVA